MREQESSSRSEKAQVSKAPTEVSHEKDDLQAAKKMSCFVTPTEVLVVLLEQYN